LELGQSAPDLHYEIGKTAAESGVRTLICVGALSRHMYDGFIQNKNNDQEAFHFGTKERCADALNTLLKPGDTVLVKASHGMGLEYIVEILKHGEITRHG